MKRLSHEPGRTHRYEAAWRGAKYGGKKEGRYPKRNRGHPVIDGVGWLIERGFNKTRRKNISLHGAGK